MINYLKYPFFILFSILVVYFYYFNLGFENINEDQYRWYDRTNNFFNAIKNGDFNSTYQQYHPGVTLIYLISVGFVSYEIFSQSQISNFREVPYYLFPVFNFWTKFWIVTFTLSLSILAFKIIKDIYGKFIGLAFLIFLIFDTYFIGLSRNLHMDALLALLIFTSLLSFYRYLQTSDKKYFWLTIFISGVGLLTKSVFGIALVFQFAIALYFSFNHKFKFAPAKNWLIVLLFSFTIFCLLFPSMWVNPLETLQKIYIQGALNTGLGGEDNFMHYVNGYELPNPGFKFYFHVLIFRLSPMILFSGIFIFLMFAIRFIKNKKISLKLDPFIVISVLFVLSYLAIILYSSKKTDRYISIVYPQIALILAFYLRDIWIKINSIALKIFFMSFTAITIIINFLIHPFYFAHYNPILGGIGEAQKRIYINQGGIAYLKVIQEFENYPGKKFTAINDAELIFSSKYPVIPLGYFNFQEPNFIKILPLQRGNNFIHNSKLVKNIEILGQPFWRIFE